PLSYTRLTFRQGTLDAARFAPDGQTIVYSAAWNGRPDEVFTTRLGATDSRTLDLAGAKLLAVSSTGELAVALHWEQDTPDWGHGTLDGVSLAGGTPREIVEKVRCADWAPDGETLAVARRGGSDFEAIEFPVGKVVYKKPISEGMGLLAIRVSPDGHRVAFVELRKGGGRRFSVVDQPGQKHA